jgi:hypothetical protein
MTDQEYNQSWHLDRKVPIAFIFAIAVQTAGIIWFAAGISHRVESLEREASFRVPQSDRLTRVEVKLENVENGILRIERLIVQPQTRP